MIFTSNRNAFNPPKGYSAPTLQLFVMDDDGKNVEMIGHLNIGSALHPTVLRDGRVMFTLFESQGLRDQRIWGIWTIHPDGTSWEPLVSAFCRVSAFQFMTQLSDGNLIVEEYYNLNNSGFGTYGTEVGQISHVASVRNTDSFGQRSTGKHHTYRSHLYGRRDGYGPKHSIMTGQIGKI